MNKLSSAAALGMLILSASPVFAQAPIIVETRPTRLVSYADLDVATAAGMETLNGRIRRAANELCTVAGDGTMMLLERLDKRRCLFSAWASARPQLEQLASRGPGPHYAGRSVVRVTAR